MKRKNKSFGLVVGLAVIAGAASFGAMSLKSTPVSATEEAITFEVVQGAGVRLGENGGIRFQANISKSYLESLTSTATSSNEGEEETTTPYVILKSSIDKMGNTDEEEALTKEWNVSDTYNENYETNAYYHAITFDRVETEKLKAAAAVNMTCTMWLEIDGTEVEGSRQSVTRSMRSVANVAYDDCDDSQKAELSKYFGERKTARAAYKELADDYAWVVDGGIVATDVYSGAALIGEDLAVGETSTGAYALFDENYNVYNVPAVTYVTKTLATAEDFKIFDIVASETGTDTDTAVPLSGYYVLVKDVEDVSASQHEGFYSKVNGKVSDSNCKTTLGFNGTFDGAGYTVTYNCEEFGLFGNILGDAVIKNAGFVATNVHRNFTSAMATGALAYMSHGGEIENVYVEMTNREKSFSTNMSMIGKRMLVSGTDRTKLTNVIVKTNNYTASSGTDTYVGGTLFYSDGARSKQNEEDVYILSDNPYVTNNTTNTEKAGQNGYANNESDTTTLNATVKYSDVNRYNSGQELYNANVTQIGNWMIADDGRINWSWSN